MLPEDDFSDAKRAKSVPHLTKLRASMRGKTRITIMLDDDVIKTFRERAQARGIGYQTAMNEALRSAAGAEDTPVTIKTLREVLRKELRSR
ncbi:MAG: CopG family transcriptional regulator [Betaproteobacteria bacterium]|nr:CopG family transcriptional regulator [Betaproteobacteria bacterium]